MQYVPSAKIATALYNLLGERFLLEQLNPLLMEHKTRFRKVEKFNLLVFRQLDGRERILKLEDATQMLDDDDEEDEDYLEQQQQETYSQDENLSSTHSNTEVVSNIHDLADDVSDITTNLEHEEDDISSCFDPEEEADDLDDDGESYMGDDSTAPPSSSFWQEPDLQEARELTYDQHIYYEEQQRYDGCPDPSQPEQYTQPSSNLSSHSLHVRVMSDTSASGVTNHSRNSDGNVERRRRSRRKSKMIKNSNGNNINNNIGDGNHNNSNGNYHANNNSRRRHENKFIRALRSMVWGSTKFMVQKTATCLYVSLVGPMTRKRLTNLKRRFLKQKAASEEAAGYRHRNSSSNKKRHPRRSSISQIESTASIPYPASQGSM